MNTARLLQSICLSLALTGSAMADEIAVDPAYTAQAEQAQALLKKAVERYRQIGDSALAEFSHQGEFTPDSLYVYVVDMHGTMLASGGPSAIYIGREIGPMLDASLRKTFQAALRQPPTDTPRNAQYPWLNSQDGKVETKQVYYRRLDDKVFAVSFYLNRSNRLAAQNLLHDAVKALQQEPESTIARINHLDSELNREDLYVFVVDTNNQKLVAHGANRRLVNTDFKALVAENGQPIGEQMLSALDGKDSAQLAYLWRNPVTGATEPKQTLLQRSDHYIVAVGYYDQPQAQR